MDRLVLALGLSAVSGMLVTPGASSKLAPTIADAVGVVAPTSPLFSVSLETELSSMTPGKPCPPNRKKRVGASLSKFMGMLSPYDIAEVLMKRVPPEVLEARSVGDDEGQDDASKMLMLTPHPVLIGPRSLGVWVQPSMVVFLTRKRALSLDAVSYCVGPVSSTSGIRLSMGQLRVRTRCTWVDEAVTHDEESGDTSGDVVPCLMWSSKVELECTAAATSKWKRLLPTRLASRVMRTLCRRAVSSALSEVQACVATAILDEYEEWRVAGAPECGDSPCIAEFGDAG